MHGIAGPDIQLLGERIGFAWTPLLPWYAAYSCAGDVLSVEVCRRRIDEVNQRLRWLKMASVASFAWVMVVLPALIVSGRLLPVLLRWAAVGVVLWVWTFTLFFRAYRGIHCSIPPFEMCLTMALSPLSLMRAPLAVSFSALSEYHPLAAAAVLCDDVEFLRIARVWYFDDPDLRGRAEQVVAKRALSHRLLSGPDAWDDGLTQFCPRCHATYLPAAAACSDCAGVPLRSLRARSAA